MIKLKFDSFQGNDKNQLINESFNTNHKEKE
jgi:hypothetical protein